MTAEHDEATQAYLRVRGFDTIEEWALDQELIYDKRKGLWHDDERKPVDLDKRLQDTMMDEAYAYLDSLD